ncbi:thioredoxin domain-containing protein C21C3.12c [Xylariales sp. AK1849]|nr:thioredoxin domain-containing protein C21C3.12c [Xylariales sp. AK1849]
MVWLDTPASSLPPLWQGLKDRIPRLGESTHVLFIVDDDKKTGQPWCPDVRAALPVLKKVFDKSEEEVLVVSVGSRDQWKTLDNQWRTRWDVKAVPTLARYTRVDDGLTQIALLEEDCKDEEKVRDFMS